ncbi:MAG: cytochrome c biogenesis heme-transporting ATPase CcmA [Proteobacteria bacterium]|nr:cytochrome c biogenesis heme-transporting ATPase CcmA [Pseudomonadota bacterium]
MKISATHLTSERNDRLLFSHLSFEVERGQILQICGENGSGKTSLLKIITGLSQPDEGMVFWNDKTIDGCREEYVKQFNYLGHKNGVTLGLTVLENLQWFMKLNGIQSSNDLSELLKQSHLFQYRDVLAQYLSAGQLRRLAILKLLICKRPLWILDEPLTSLDADGVSWVKELFIRHVKNDGLIILTCHQGFQDFPLTIHRLMLNS